MSIEKILLIFSSSLFIFFCYFPYVDFLGLGTTTQPNALVFSVISLFLLRAKKVPPEIYAFFFLSFFSLFFLLFTKLSFLAFRDWMNYLSLSIVSYVTYKLMKYKGGLSYNFFISVIMIWFLAAVLQLTFDPSILSFMLSKVRGIGDTGRGVSSFSTEPTYYGLMLGLFFVIYLCYGWYRKSKLLGVFIVGQILFIAKSSTVVAILFVSVAIYLFLSLLQLKIKYLIVSISSIIIIIIIFPLFLSDWLEQTRMYELGMIIAKNPTLVFVKDFSLSERVNHAFFPVVSLWDNCLIPGGFGNFGDYLEAKKNSGQYDVLFAHELFRKSTRILSGYGKIFFEMGGISLLVPFSIFTIFRKGLGNSAILFAYIFFNLLLFAALPFMTATVPFVIGNILYLRHTKQLR